MDKRDEERDQNSAKSSANSRQSKLPRKSGNFSEKIAAGSNPHYTTETRHSSNVPRINPSHLPTSSYLPTSRPNFSRTATATSSSLPLQLQSAQSSITESGKITRPGIEAQSSNLKLTPTERNALIRTVLHKEVYSNDQSQESLSSTRSDDVEAPPANSGNQLEEELKASLTRQRQVIEAKRSAQEKIIFNRTEPEVQPVMSPSHGADVQSKNKTPEKATPSPRDQPNVQTDKSTPKSWPKKNIFVRTLPPISEASELNDDDDRNNLEANERTNRELIRASIKASENKRREQMESELSTDWIQNTDASSLLRYSDDSDSLDELVIKDFTIKVVESEPDVAVTSLPITEQAIIESKKLKDSLESIRNKLRDNVPEQSTHRSDSVQQSQHEKDNQKLRELFENGALISSITNDRFEEGVLDLLLRQSDSLWDPVVPGGIPIGFFLPNKNYEKGILDTSITETNLMSPLRPEKNLPGSLEVDSENVDMDVTDDENVLILGLPKFSYEPAQQYFYRRKFKNLLDSDESKDSDDILDDQEMNFDDLTENVAEPTYDFAKAKHVLDSEIQKRIYRGLKENGEVASKPVPEVRSINPLEVFQHSQNHFNVLFGVDQNEIFRERHVASDDMASLCRETPLFHSEIIRDVSNCHRHFEIMKLIYMKIVKFMQQPQQPCSSEMGNNFNEIIERFVKIADGRICARLQSCASQTRGNADEASQSPQKTKQATQDNGPQTQSEHQMPVKISKSVSFPDETQPENVEQLENPLGDGDNVDRWRTLDIKQVRKLIEHAREAQAKRKTTERAQAKRKSTESAQAKRKTTERKVRKK